MLIILSGISRSKFNMIFILFAIISPFRHATGIILTEKYTYGKSIDGHQHIYKSKITDNDSSYVSFFTEKQAISKKNDIEISVKLNVKTLSQNVLATLEFKNTSKHNLYIDLSTTPLNRDDEYPYYFRSLCKDMFSIFSENVKLDFLGNECQFENTDWIKISPQQLINYTIAINGSYLFLPGKHSYQIQTANFFMADKSWFTTENTNKLIFSILDYNYPTCTLSTHAHYFQKETDLCEIDPWQLNSIENFMRENFIGGYKNNNFFEISSNRISIIINGDKIKAFDDLPRSKRS